MTDEPMVFECEGEELVGIATLPEPDAAIGVVILVGGPQYRVGSHRQFVLLARELARAGIAVLRFDFRGMGDSGGDVQSFEQTTPDVAAAIDALQRAAPSVKSVVLWGLCDGASACLLYWHATRDARIAGLVLANPWVFSEDAFAGKQMRHHSQRLLQADFWAGILRGDFEIATALKWLAGRVRALGRSAKEAARESFQERMRKALETFGNPVLVVLSGADLTAKGFLEYTAGDASWSALLRRPNVQQRHLAAADHTFSTAAERHALERLNVEWVKAVAGQVSIST